VSYAHLKDVADLRNDSDRDIKNTLRQHFCFSNIPPVLLESHISLAIDWECLFDGKAIQNCIFLDLDQILLCFDVVFPQDTIILSIYRESFPSGNLPVTSQLAPSICLLWICVTCERSKFEFCASPMTARSCTISFSHIIIALYPWQGKGKGH
jgi:hypothetical protein